MRDLTGVTIQRYELTEMLGYGGYACVYAARRLPFKEARQAVKVLLPELLPQRLPERIRESIREAFIREAEIQHDFDHLLTAHGLPWIGGGQAALRALVEA